MLYRVHLTISGIRGDRPLTHFITQHCIEYISPLAGLVVIDMHKLSTEISMLMMFALIFSRIDMHIFIFLFTRNFQLKLKVIFKHRFWEPVFIV